MSEMKHTPGPWYVDHGDLSFAIMAGPAFGRVVVVPGSNERCHADASLIAAAPDLLEAAIAVLAARKDAMLNLADAMRKLEAAARKAGAA